MMTMIKTVVVLLIGFSIGFFLGLAFLDPVKRTPSPLKDKASASSQCDQEHTAYDRWLKGLGAHKVHIDVDEYLHRKVPPRQATLESEWLRKKIHVTCVVFVEREKNLKAAQLTWLKHCNSHVLYHTKKPFDHRERFSSTLGIRSIESKSSWHFLCNVIRNLWVERGHEIQWVLFVNDDMFVVPENLRYIVAHRDFNKPSYFGHTMILWGQSYNLASAGYILSKGSISLLASNFTSSESCQKGGKYWKKEDFYLGQNLRKLNVFPEDTRDALCQGRFHGYNLNQLLLENKLASIAPYWRTSLFPVTQGKNCCSKTSVAFQGIEADKIYMYDYIINHLNVYIYGVYGNRPAPTPYPPEQVWQKFLLDQGYTYVKNVSAEEYLKAWKDRISHDVSSGKFITKRKKGLNIPQRGEDGHGEVFAVPFEIEAVLDSDHFH